MLRYLYMYITMIATVLFTIIVLKRANHIHTYFFLFVFVIHSWISGIRFFYHTKRFSVIGLNPQVVKSRRNYSRVWNRKHSSHGSMIYGQQDRTAITRISMHSFLLLSLHYITLAYLLFHMTTNKRDNLVCRATDIFYAI